MGAFGTTNLIIAILPVRKPSQASKETLPDTKEVMVKQALVLNAVRIECSSQPSQMSSSWGQMSNKAQPQ
jgi:hypothetical protein